MIPVAPAVGDEVPAVPVTSADTGLIDLHAELAHLDQAARRCAGEAAATLGALTADTGTALRILEGAIAAALALEAGDDADGLALRRIVARRARQLLAEEATG